MNRERRAVWEEKHHGSTAGSPEPPLVDLLPLIPRGVALDIAAGTGRNAIALARAGFKVVAADYSIEAMRMVGSAARQESLPIWPIIADLEETFPFADAAFDLVLNISFLDRALIPRLRNALRVGGMLFFDTFLIHQLASGHPNNPRFMLQHYELREMLSDMELIRYREGLTVYSEEKRAWRATALARRLA